MQPIGWVSFSVAEVGLLCSPVALWLLWRRARHGAEGAAPSRLASMVWMCSWLLILGCLAFSVFECAWGFNHTRRSFAELAGWAIPAPEVDALAALTVSLTLEANEQGKSWRETQQTEGQAPMALRGGADGDRDLHGAWTLQSQIFVFLEGPPVPVRQPWVSPLMSAIGLAGIFSPLTGEAHINHQMPVTLHPFVAAHEVAHGRGFAREDEANFIAYLVCRASANPAHRYSGALQALASTLSALRRADRGRYRTLESQLSPETRADLAQQNEFWRTKRTPLFEVTQVANDAYLKSQGQKHGVQSYGRMVNLLLAERAHAE